MPNFAQLDMEKLFALTMRILSEETVHEAQDFIELVGKAAEIVKSAGLRILGVDSRTLLNPHEDEIMQVVNAYQGD